MKQAAIYLRVSTDGQTTENQKLALITLLNRAGWDLAGIYEDAGISGAKGRELRPALDNLLKDASRRKFDVVVAWSVDRLGRSLSDLTAMLKELHSLGIDLVLHQQGVDTTTPAGKALFGMLGVFSEFERALIQERVRAGLVRARANGRRLGRPIVATPQLQTKIRTARAKGLSLRKIAKQLGVSAGTVHSVLAANAH